MKSIEQTPGRCPRTSPESIVDTIGRLAKCVRWLVANDIGVIGYNGLAHNRPVVFVTPSPRVYVLFSGEYARIRFGMNEGGHYEDWEALDRLNQVAVQWTEVSA